MKIVTIGDVGPIDDEFHVGDEAMLEVLLHELSARGVASWTVVSANPADTGTRYGCDAIPRIGFAPSDTGLRSEREDRRSRVLAAAEGSVDALEWQDPAWAVIEAVAASDGVVIAGGGNLSSLWPDHIYERSTLAAIARQFGKPVVVTGQTLGPALLGRDGELLAGLLTGASLVGVREAASHDIARRLGVESAALGLLLDDASFLDGDPGHYAPERPYCAVTVSEHFGASDPVRFQEEFARLLDHVVDVGDLDILMIPHLGSIGEGVRTGDVAAMDRLASTMRSDRTTVTPVRPAHEVVGLTRGASLVVSTRYHPLVFGMSAGIPSIGISVDQYTSVKLSGALRNFGLGDWALPALALPTDAAIRLVDETHEGRREIEAHLRAILPAARDHSQRWWDEVAAVFGGGKPTRPDPLAVPTLRRGSSIDAESVARLDAWALAESTLTTGRFLAMAEEAENLASLRADLGRLELELAEYDSEVQAARQQAEDAETALTAAHKLMTAVAEPLFARALSAASPLEPATELQALLNTRTFRWSRVPRRFYGAIRRRLARFAKSL